MGDSSPTGRYSTQSHYGSTQEVGSPYKVSPYIVRTSRHTGPVIVGGTRSQFGAQTESFKQTSPKIGFGTGPRFKQENQFISDDHSKSLVPTWTPGPGTYKPRGSVGDQPESFRSNPRKPEFSKDTRFGPDIREIKRRGEMPSPGDYETAISCVGPQLQSKTGNASPIRFGTSTREKNICQKGFETPFFGIDSPGPKYPAGHGALGPQPYGHRRNGASIGFTKELRNIDPKRPNKKDLRTGAEPAPNAYNTREKIARQKPAISFTKDTRDHAHYVSLSKEAAEAILKGAISQGPDYDGRPSVGEQNEAGKKNSSVTRFTKASRFPKSKLDDTPGPGAYTT